MPPEQTPEEIWRATLKGDRQWRELLNNYYAAVRKELAFFRGREVNTAGDGVSGT